MDVGGAAASLAGMEIKTKLVALLTLVVLGATAAVALAAGGDTNGSGRTAADDTATATPVATRSAAHEASQTRREDRGAGRRHGGDDGTADQGPADAAGGSRPAPAGDDGTADQGPGDAGVVPGGADDRGREAEPGDDRGGHGEIEAGDDHGGGHRGHGGTSGHGGGD
jgi:hypothetical protein